MWQPQAQILEPKWLRTHEVRKLDSLDDIQGALYHVNPGTFRFVDIGNMVGPPFAELAHGR